MRIFVWGKGLNGEPALWIGTVQGYKDGLENAKHITKKMFGYRPKNFYYLFGSGIGEIL